MLISCSVGQWDLDHLDTLPCTKLFSANFYCKKSNRKFLRLCRPCLPGGSDSIESTCNAGDLGLIPRLGRFPGGGCGNPLQYSCLENPMDRGAQWATVHRVTKSRTRLKWLSRQAGIGDIMSTLVYWFLRCWCSLLPSPAWPCLIYLDSWT